MLLGSALVIAIKITIKVEALVDEFINGLGTLAQCIGYGLWLGARGDINLACFKAVSQKTGKPIGICCLYLVLVKPLEFIQIKCGSCPVYLTKIKETDHLLG